MEPGIKAPEIKTPLDQSPSMCVLVSTSIASERSPSRSPAGPLTSTSGSVGQVMRSDQGTILRLSTVRSIRREKKEAYVRGREHYERYRVKARLTKFFDTSRFPFSDQGLTIQMEDGTHGAERLRYVADEQESGINRSGVPRSLKITKSLMTVKLHSYGSRRGDPRLSAGTADVHSRFIFAMLVSPPSLAVIH